MVEYSEIIKLQSQLIEKLSTKNHELEQRLEAVEAIQ